MTKRSFSSALNSDIVRGIVHVRDPSDKSTASNGKVLTLVAFMMILAWILEHWLGHVAYSWVLIGATFWITSMHAKQGRQEDLNQQRLLLSTHWEQQVLKNKPITGKEATEWLSKLICKLWPNVGEPRLLKQLQLLTEKNSRSDKPQSIRGIEMEDATLGNVAPEIGLGRTFWSTDSVGQEVLNTGLRWVSNGLHIRLSMQLGGSYLRELADVIISDVQVQGDLRILPILDGQGLLYSFVNMPDVNISMALSPNSHHLPVEATGIRLWLEQLLSDSLYLATGSNGHHLWTLLPVNLNKTCIGGFLTATVISASNLSHPLPKPNDTLGPEQLETGRVIGPTFAEISFEGVQRQTQLAVLKGANPEWGDSVNLIMHDNEGLLQLAIYERKEDGIACELLGTCNIKVKYGEDDSVFYWAVSSQEKVVASRGERPGLPVNLTVPLLHAPSGTITVQLTLEEWIFARDDNKTSPSKLDVPPGPFGWLWPPLRPLTGLTLRVTILEGRELGEAGTKPHVKPYLRLQYGKNSRRTRAVSDVNPVWREEFNFAEVMGETQLRFSCFDASTWQHCSLGTARINPQSLVEGNTKELRLPLENVDQGEIWIRAEVGKWKRPERGVPDTKPNDLSIVPLNYTHANDGQSEGNSSPSEKLRLVVVEAQDLKSADRNGDLDAYVSLRYGTSKQKTKVVQRSQSPRWNQTFEFSFSPKPILLHVKDHRSLVTSQSIGHVEIDPHSLPPNEIHDRWYALKEVAGGEIRLQVTRIQPGQGQDKNKVSTPTFETTTTIAKLEESSHKLRHLVEQVLAVAEEKENSEVQRLIEDFIWHEDQREDFIAKLQTDRDLLILKVKQLEKAVSDFL